MTALDHIKAFLDLPGSATLEELDDAMRRIAAARPDELREALGFLGQKLPTSNRRTWSQALRSIRKELGRAKNVMA